MKRLVSVRSIIGAAAGGAIGWVVSGFNPWGMVCGAMIGFSLGMALDPATSDVPGAGAPDQQGLQIMTNSKTVSFLNVDKSIITQTREENDIDNFQNPGISDSNKQYYRIIENKYPKAEKRSYPTGIYNCHGLTFASRRCFIEDSNQIPMILKDDNYTEIKLKDALPGDVVVYYDEGDAEHSGLIIEKPEAPLYIPLVVSKWSSHAEFIHLMNYCPYNKTNIKIYRIFK